MAVLPDRGSDVVSYVNHFPRADLQKDHQQTGIENFCFVTGIAHGGNCGMRTAETVVYLDNQESVWI